MISSIPNSAQKNNNAVENINALNPNKFPQIQKPSEMHRYLFYLIFTEATIFSPLHSHNI
jgi:hypothetical protein